MLSLEQGAEKGLHLSLGGKTVESGFGASMDPQ